MDLEINDLPELGGRQGSPWPFRRWRISCPGFARFLGYTLSPHQTISHKNHSWWVHGKTTLNSSAYLFYLSKYLQQVPKDVSQVPRDVHSFTIHSLSPVRLRAIHHGSGFDANLVLFLGHRAWLSTSKTAMKTGSKNHLGPPSSKLQLHLGSGNAVFYIKWWIISGS